MTSTYHCHTHSYTGCRLPRWHGGKSRRHKRRGFDPWCWEDPLEEELGTHSSMLAWKIPWTEETGILQSLGLQTVGHTHTHTIWRWVFFTGTSGLFHQTLNTTGSGDLIYGKGLLSKMPSQIVPLYRDPEDIYTLGWCSGVRLGLVRECFFLQHSLLFIDSLLLLITMFKAIETAKICIIRYLTFSIQPYPEPKRIWTVPYKNFLL